MMFLLGFFYQNKGGIGTKFTSLGLTIFMRGSRKVLSVGVLNSDVFGFFQLMRGSKYHLKQAFIGPQAKHYLNGILLAG